MFGQAISNGGRLDWTFYCQQSAPGEFDEQVRALGARIIRSPVPLTRTRSFMAALRCELRQGDYDVLHCHHDVLSAVYLLAAAGLPIGKRIVHAHNADLHLPTASPFKAAVLREPMRRICLGADRVVGISDHTLDTMLGGRPRRAGRDLVHYYGVDPQPFIQASGDRSAFRRALGLPEDALVMLFGGRITPEKNPLFAVDVFACLLAREPRAALVFAGAGSLEAEVAARASELGVADRMRMLGWRSDLPEIMCCADWFILPRPETPMEGFGLAVVEAQLAGLRLLLSHGIADDPLLPTASVRRLSLRDGADRWADAAIELLSQTAPSRAEAIAALEASPMNMDVALAELQALHG
jgi:glycosyltransferase involved in cell wall biosynthesis